MYNKIHMPATLSGKPGQYEDFDKNKQKHRTEVCCMAARYGDDESLSKFISDGYEYKYKGYRGLTPLELAKRHNNKNIVELINAKI